MSSSTKELLLGCAGFSLKLGRTQEELRRHHRHPSTAVTAQKLKLKDEEHSTQLMVMSHDISPSTTTPFSPPLITI